MTVSPHPSSSIFLALFCHLPIYLRCVAGTTPRTAAAVLRQPQRHSDDCDLWCQLLRAGGEDYSVCKVRSVPEVDRKEWFQSMAEACLPFLRVPFLRWHSQASHMCQFSIYIHIFGSSASPTLSFPVSFTPHSRRAAQAAEERQKASLETGVVADMLRNAEGWVDPPKEQAVELGFGTERVADVECVTWAL